MQEDETKEMFRLCTLIQIEQDPRLFSALLDELNALLEEKEKRLKGANQKSRP